MSTPPDRGRGFVRRLKTNPPTFVVDPAAVAAGSWFNAMLSLASLLRFSAHVHGDLVDLGCGPASHRVWYEERVSSVTLVDWPASPHDTAAVDILADLNKPLPLEDGIADTVLMTSVLEHLSTPAMALAETRRILRTDGALLLQVPFLYRVHEEPHDYFRYTRFGIRSLLEQAGLDVVAGETYGNLAAVMVDLLAKGGVNLTGAVVAHMPQSVADGARRGSFTLLEQIQKAAFCLVAQPTVRRLSSRLGQPEQFPLGYTVVAVPRAAATKPMTEAHRARNLQP